MSGWFGGGKTTSTSTTTQAPWSDQQSYLTDAWGQARNIAQQRSDAGPYSGNFTAGTNQNLTDAQTGAPAWANGGGQGVMNNAYNTSMIGQGGAQDFHNNAAGMAQNGMPGADRGTMDTMKSYAQGGQMSGVPQLDQGLSNAINAAGTAGAQGLANYNNGIANVASSAVQDHTGQLASDAQRYMNSGAVQSAVGNVNSQIDQTLNEQTNPGFNRAAAAGGTMNSSRAGMGEAMNNENAAIAKGNADSSIMNNAYNQGLSTASNQLSSGLQTAGNLEIGGMAQNNQIAQGAGNLGLNAQTQGTNSRLQAGNTALTDQLGYNNADTTARLNANAQLGDGVTQGYQGGQAASSAAQSNFNLLNGAGTSQQQGDQAGLNNSLSKWNMQNSYPQSILNNEYGIVGSNNWGASNNGTNTTQQPNNTAGSLAGLGLGVGGLFAQGGALNGAGNWLGKQVGNWFS